ncbi:MAG: AmmeMemoRadiSam system protein A [Methylococcales bacterium]|nr:AmmeMemoRadiSam system protein A [Methylococcales bacterium]
MSLTEEQKNRLLKLAGDAIRYGLETGKRLTVDSDDFPGELASHRASFVTLERNGQLRGCIGRLEPCRPLAQDVAENAFSAAFRDPRFEPLDSHELAGLDIHISILSPAAAIQFDSEPELVRQLRPGIDGLILEEGRRRATFLPSVWESLPSPAEFVQHLKLKAGLPADYWSDTLRAYRYTAEYIP